MEALAPRRVGPRIAAGVMAADMMGTVRYAGSGRDDRVGRVMGDWGESGEIGTVLNHLLFYFLTVFNRAIFVRF